AAGSRGGGGGRCESTRHASTLAGSYSQTASDRMIASLNGRVGAITPEFAVIEVGQSHSVGYAVHCTSATLAALRVGESTRLATSLVVREDSLTLYGFADDAERVIFELLQSASGVGPRLAQAALAVHPPAALRRAIMSGDLVALTKVPGIGKKGAQRIVLELTERVTALSLPGVGGAESAEPTTDIGHAAEPIWRQQVRQGLEALGWSARQAQEATELAVRDGERGRATQSANSEDTPGAEPVPDVAVVLKAAIAILGRNR
ncbi:MAG: Holliday junction branch migration protein RuvA, partial [Mycobacteriales bacterium]